MKPDKIKETFLQLKETVKMLERSASNVDLFSAIEQSESVAVHATNLATALKAMSDALTAVKFREIKSPF